MWTKAWRKNAVKELSKTWDIIIIGGGITGAGIFAEASRNGLSVLLVEENDFCYGASSRSSKMIHGGFRYLYQGDIQLTRHAAREREFLLKKYPGLIEPMTFVLPVYKGRSPSKFVVMAGLFIYDFLAGRWHHGWWDAAKMEEIVPDLDRNNLKGGVHFIEGTTDDVRQVLRLLHEGSNFQCMPLNYMGVESLIKENGKVSGVVLKDGVTGQTYEAKGRLVINATGAWADKLREQVSEKPLMRPLRGSHLLFPASKIPVKQCITIFHPKDKRPVFAYPWENITLVGTTDLDHKESLSKEPYITQEEISYLMEGVNLMFPSLALTENDIISSYAGVRPIISTGKSDPSKEKRDYAIWDEEGLLTVTGGKYTTFRIVSRKALIAAQKALPGFKLLPEETIEDLQIFDLSSKHFSEKTMKRIVGYYGADALRVLDTFKKEDLEPIDGTPLLWGELTWAARNESVIHLDDLLLRRTRVGLLIPKGAEMYLDRIGQICRKELDWTQDRWELEKENYLRLWRHNYSVPEQQQVVYDHAVR